MGVSAANDLETMSNRDLDFLFSCLKIHPEHSSVIFKLASLIRTAAQVYLSRAANTPSQVVTELVHQFLAETMTYNATSPGGHILIWPFFIVGAECSSKRDREFVIMQLQSLWYCTGFGSPLYAIKLLKEIWREAPGTNWTQTLVDKVEGFIM
ncbi:fungal-specific transcription factor domain-containing protein [Aspergillus bertholletiae]|uniref:Fungal-specific transcription factor domain-containing protein n=1 Tax=Aspergillus bertholletiae TaxID=1226010 RepID=A0A5N7AU42_9EURO|nr:fungal-specific transcription factor domain-containing protein [Aspergillus bertholletiae]